MPFKSKAQQRFMFDAEERGDIPKGTAERWARETPDIGSLPERKKGERNMDKKAHFKKLAQDLGRLHAKKTAGAQSALWRYGLPAVAGYALAGPGYGTEGALAGLAAGHFLTPKALKALASRSKPAAEAIGRDPNIADLVGRGALGAGGGYAVGRLLGARNPYGLQPVFPGLERENPMGLRPE